MSDAQTAPKSEGHDKVLFWGCFVALIATAFGFVIRSMIIGDWQVEFDLTETQKGELLGVGLWPFAISIVLFSLIIDRVGYGKAMVFAFACHIVSAILTIFATGYWMLYIGTFIVALGNGTVEAVVNPVVATMFSKDKSKWLNALHAGWPGGLVLGGVLTIALGVDVSWKLKVGLIFIPTVVYGLMLLGRKFPIHERVAAGVSYKEMLAEAGAIGALIVAFLVTSEVGRVFHFPVWLEWVIIAVVTIGYWLYVRSLGRPLFIFLLLIMMPLATTELGTDTWVTNLMGPEMEKLGVQAGWVLVYTSLIMMILRFFAGPMIHRFSPLGLLAICAAIACVGLVFLSKATGLSILAAATIYGVGKSFFWPTMLGVVAERFPRGGALTLNTIAGVGMLAVGVVGASFLGYFQDSTIDKQIAAYDEENGTVLHTNFMTDETGIFGAYKAIDQEKLAEAPDEDKATVTEVTAVAKKSALAMVAIFPLIMLVCYIILIAYFKARGGYSAVHLDEQEA